MCAHISINVSSVPTNSPSSILSNASGFSWWSSHPMQLSCPNRNYHSLKLCSNIARNSQAHCYTPKVLLCSQRPFKLDQPSFVATLSS